jgi:hypothetical protein
VRELDTPKSLSRPCACQISSRHADRGGKVFLLKFPAAGTLDCPGGGTQDATQTPPEFGIARVLAAEAGAPRDFRAVSASRRTTENGSAGQAYFVGAAARSREAKESVKQPNCR